MCTRAVGQNTVYNLNGNIPTVTVYRKYIYMPGECDISSNADKEKREE